MDSQKHIKIPLLIALFVILGPHTNRISLEQERVTKEKRDKERRQNVSVITAAVCRNLVHASVQEEKRLDDIRLAAREKWSGDVSAIITRVGSALAELKEKEMENERREGRGREMEDTMKRFFDFMLKEREDLTEKLLEVIIKITGHSEQGKENGDRKVEHDKEEEEYDGEDSEEEEEEGEEGEEGEEEEGYDDEYSGEEDEEYKDEEEEEECEEEYEEEEEEEEGLTGQPPFPLSDFDPFAPEFTCIGITKKGRRCRQGMLPRHNVSCAARRLQQLCLLSPSSDSFEKNPLFALAALRELADWMLCGWHREKSPQGDRIAREWYALLVPAREMPKDEEERGRKGADKRYETASDSETPSSEGIDASDYDSSSCSPTVCSFPSPGVADCARSLQQG
ncbi:hypothetical protein ASPZODRAFT_2130492 [Penicilliopsis zonata CBS 506.65]|uniref:Uncharacterized protein n=1 Tax=Penicilliopsis zonata CBS 506.65 TaxID=1073090 RepID=A0A1L9SHV2_9EURO|nr:hypothetical protein ASPZODRAFT_2130492 [Penicilliopsis zonata CBS 506.65]OJJ46789.1 hypothetical protein ASPZODRAFT_2130492 [Penicilliopsis zonata CBS 506.65]